MISSTACSKPLRKPLRPSLRLNSSASPLRRSSTVHANYPPHHGVVLSLIRTHIGRESKLHRLRDVFLEPGVSHLKPPRPTAEKPPPPPPPLHSNLPHALRKVIQAQLKHCDYRADYLIFVSAILAQPALNPYLKHDAVQTICARLLQRLLDDPSRNADQKMLTMAHAIRFKLEDAHIPLPDTLLGLALLCAANCHSFASLKLYLREYRRQRLPVPPRLFCLVVDRVADNPHRVVWTQASGLRPWSEEHALDVMLRFFDAPPNARYDLGSFLPRSEWRCVARWLHALARRNAVRQLHAEWVLWREDPRRQDPRECACPEGAAGPSPTVPSSDRETMWRLRDAGMWNTRTRGDLALLEAFRLSGCIKKAWSVWAASDIPFGLLQRRTRSAMLAHPEFIPRELWTDEIRAALSQKLADDLAEIEAEFQVEWVWDERSGTGHHRLARGSWLAELEDFKEDLLPGLAANWQPAVDLPSVLDEKPSPGFNLRYHWR